MKKIKISVAIVGAQGSGKTTLLEQFIFGKVQQQYNPTEQSMLQCRSILLEEQDTLVQFKIFDTCTSKFDQEILDCNAFILLYDVINLQSIEFIVQFCKQHLKQQKTLVVGNKLDLLQNKYTQSNIDEFCKQIKAKQIQVSGLKGTNVHSLFMMVANEFVRSIDNEEQQQQQKQQNDYQQVKKRIDKSCQLSRQQFLE